MCARTSHTHPITVDFLPQELHGLPGRLGMSYAPGKQEPFPGPNAWRRDLDADLNRLREVWDVGHLVCLVEAHELDLLRIPHLFVQAHARGIQTTFFPIPDMGAPASLDATAALADSIWASIAEGRTVLLHCWGGFGRTGTIASACLIARGFPAKEAVEHVRRARPGTVETEAQEGFLAKFEGYRNRITGS